MTALASDSQTAVLVPVPLSLLLPGNIISVFIGGIDTGPSTAAPRRRITSIRCQTRRIAAGLFEESVLTTMTNPDGMQYLPAISEHRGIRWRLNGSFVDPMGVVQLCRNVSRAITYPS